MDMKFDRFLKEDYLPNFTEYLILCERTTPLPDETFLALKSAGKKLGVRVKKSDTVWDYLKRAGKGLNDLMRSVAIYMSTDIGNTDLKKKLVNDMKKKIRKVDRKEIAAFLIQLDKASIGITSHIRHILQSILGVEVATYNRWIEDFEYMEKELRHVRKVLKRVGASEKEIAALNNFENMIMNLKGDS
jgi:hypothetical protein